MMTRCGTLVKPKAALAFSFVSKSMPPCVMWSQSCSSTSSWAKSGSSKHNATKTTLSPNDLELVDLVERLLDGVEESWLISTR